MNFRVEDKRIFITLAAGDYINKSFESLAEGRNISAAWLNGIGAIQDPEIGFYSLSSKSYLRKQFIGEFELTSLNGNITLRDGEPFAHTHITFSDSDYKVFGGHLFDAKITAAGEFILNPGSENITRKMNEKIGLPLWCLEDTLD